LPRCENFTVPGALAKFISKANHMVSLGGTDGGTSETGELGESVILLKQPKHVITEAIQQLFKFSDFDFHH
jgi:hypothetical protein